MKISSWNVNGIRACVKKGFCNYVEEYDPDIICLQEIKATQDDIPSEVLNLDQYEMIFAPAVKKGYSGVALMYKKTLYADVKIGLGMKKYDDEGRTIIAEFDDFILICGYFPNGQRDHNRVPYKLSYSRKVAKTALELIEETNKGCIITGDFNTAQFPIDLANPKTNTKSTGFLPNERKWMDDFVKQGFTDALRIFHKDEPGLYTWWTYRGNCRERNKGWRIDYFFSSDQLLENITDCYHLPEVMGSDHCPIMLEMNL